MDVVLIPGTAILDRDYAGFMNGGNVISQTVVFAPNETRVDLPLIFIRNNATCDSEFSAEMETATVKEGVVKNNSTRIILPCN